MRHHGSKAARFILDNSLLWLAGTIIAVAWANLAPMSHDRVAHPLHFWVNDVGMVFFFALAAKEVFEATLPGGPLSSLRSGHIAGGRPRHHRPDARMGHSLCDRYRILGDDGPHHLPGGTPGNSVPHAARHCRRRAQVGHPGGFYPTGALSLIALIGFIVAAVGLAW
jgi:hypothetical protein